MAQEFQLVAGHLALDFTNTLDYRYDPERLVDLLPNYESFLAFCHQSGIITPTQVRKLLDDSSESEARRAHQHVIEFREALYFLILAVLGGRRPDESALRTFNSFLADFRVPDRIDWRKNGFLRNHSDIAETPMGPLSLIVDASTVLLTSPDLHHIRECSENTCRWLFLDRSRNHSRLWCDMRLCGNRSKARRFYARTRNAV